MSKKKNEKKVSSADSLEGAKETLETQPTPTLSTDTPEEKAPETQPETEKKTVEVKLPKGIADTFKARPHIKAAYVSGDKWFFSKTLAKQAFESFDVIENPYTPPALPGSGE